MVVVARSTSMTMARPPASRPGGTRSGSRWTWTSLSSGIGQSPGRGRTGTSAARSGRFLALAAATGACWSRQKVRPRRDYRYAVEELFECILVRDRFERGAARIIRRAPVTLAEMEDRLPEPLHFTLPQNRLVGHRFFHVTNSS